MLTLKKPIRKLYWNKNRVKFLFSHFFAVPQKVNGPCHCLSLAYFRNKKKSLTLPPVSYTVKDTSGKMAQKSVFIKARQIENVGIIWDLIR